ncbi:CDP-diacylglycerol--glycerol-3-phosphate 3-phosphatidyltransferase [Limnochorda pilosa]|uniref:CDP-diacylglycerol--glycerol-3-phosphate 3-phosphatidyltransferase n=1 Tax=Limnochorda pilosa TaxID=1555112 RepID=A0A0K2SJ59_LIMPI|nr:CDP-diacylglycerol--glycerol-3-phosphate 3-phosphatidyltransferase [Limnochorda pilosa]BAS27067.1 CDP-diacylglycerol--glycerol-3-phosphate 3-phosphatidyltransferase [Limnochorda pilosa]
MQAQDTRLPASYPVRAKGRPGHRGLHLDLTPATWLSLSRIGLVPPMLAALLGGAPHGLEWAAGLFILAALTDAVDGHLARYRREETTFGKLLDPVSDKLLVSAALIGLVQLGLVSTWAAVAVVAREMAVTGLRLVLAGEGVLLPAGPWGKRKTLVQCVALPALMLGVPGAGFLLWLAVGLTLWSGFVYFREAVAVPEAPAGSGGSGE